MGNALVGDGEKKKKELEPIIERCYARWLQAGRPEQMNLAQFTRLVYEIVEEINKKLGNTQLRVPKVSTLERVYQTHHQGKGKSVTKDDFRNILQDVMMDTGFTGIGAKDIILYLFGIPVTAMFIKQRVAPHTIPNEIFIPGITSVTVFLLAKLNKL